MKKICVLPGDGIGPEVLGCAVSVLKAATDHLEFIEASVGKKARDEQGSSLPQTTLDIHALRRRDNPSDL